MERERAKAVSLGTNYGISPYGVAAALGIPVAEGRQLLAAALRLDAFSLSRHPLRTEAEGNVMPAIEPNGVALPTIGREDQKRCEELLQRWMVALNSYDASGMKSVMRFPHVRLAENRLAIYQADDNPMDLFTRLRQQHGWHHSAWNEIKLVQSSPTKAHYAVQYTRYHEDGSVLSVCDSLYIFTCVDGDWRLQGRSSFGA